MLILEQRNFLEVFLLLNLKKSCPMPITTIMMREAISKGFQCNHPGEGASFGWYLPPIALESALAAYVFGILTGQVFKSAIFETLINPIGLVKMA